jgi:hypothetical protein
LGRANRRKQLGWERVKARPPAEPRGALAVLTPEEMALIAGHMRSNSTPALTGWMPLTTEEQQVLDKSVEAINHAALELSAATEQAYRARERVSARIAECRQQFCVVVANRGFDPAEWEGDVDELTGRVTVHRRQS